MRYNRYIKHILNRKLGGYVYEKGDLIIYGNQSVCRIENIGVISIGKPVSYTHLDVYKRQMERYSKSL